MVARGAGLAETGIKQAERILKARGLAKTDARGQLTQAGEALDSVKRLLGRCDELKELLKKVLCVTRGGVPATGMRSRFLLDGSLAAPHGRVPSARAKAAKKR
jgi:hypothetical protein